MTLLDQSNHHSSLVSIVPTENTRLNTSTNSETTSLRLTTFGVPRAAAGGTSAINRDREDHSRSSSLQRRRAAAATGGSARENITSAVSRNSIGLRRRQLFSAALQTRAQRLRGEGHNERRLLR